MRRIRKTSTAAPPIAPPTMAPIGGAVFLLTGTVVEDEEELTMDDTEDDTIENDTTEDDTEEGVLVMVVAVASAATSRSIRSMVSCDFPKRVSF